MKGELSPTEQLRVLGRIWGPDREGYVFLPWIEGKAKDKDDRKTKYHEGRAWEWPGDRDGILAHLGNHAGDDVYFTPCLFFDKRRIEGYAITEATLWADLDAVDPRNVDPSYHPTIAWMSSPNRYQAVWILHGKLREGLSWGGKENHRLTMFLGADQSGWDTTQLLRVPGRSNFKPEYRHDGNPVRGELLWDDGPRYTIQDFDDLPEVTVADVGDVDLIDEELVSGIDRHDVWGRVRLRVSPTIRDYMAVRTTRQANEIGKDQPEGRSGVQWQIMRELADAGCTVAEIVAVLRPSVWNTFVGRSDELKRLKIGAAKAVGERTTDASDDGGALEVLDVEKPALRWLADVMATPLPRPRWLVRNIWAQGGCGFIAGDPKSYKSWMGLDFALSVATGTPFLGDPQFSTVGGPRPVLYIQEEDSEIIVRNRLETVLEGKSPTHHWHGYMTADHGQLVWLPPVADIPLGFHVRSGFTASDPGWQAWLAEVMSEGQFDLVVIDTMGTTAGDVDTDRASDLMGRILRPLKEISNTTGAAVCVIHHNRKGTNGDQRGGQRMLGSVALHAWVDDALYVGNTERRQDGSSKVYVERESKSATELKWTIEIPRMGVWPDGTRTVWEPATGLWDASNPPSDDTPRASTPPRQHRVAGTNALTKAKLLGARKGRPVLITRMAEVHGITEAKMWQQVQQAISNGLLTGDREGGVWPA
jgi:hypothetical protein